MKVAINGTGIAGPTLAYWLKHYGHEPVLFEKSPTLRTGGYIIDFWGAGYKIADKMGIIPTMMKDAYIMERIRTVTAGGYTTSSLNVKSFMKLNDGRYMSIARSELARNIYNACDGIETRLATSVTGFEDHDDKTEVQLSNGKSEDFDLLIGADGLHSHVRELAFGPQENFEKHLGFYVAAFTLSNYQPRDELTYLSHTVPGKQVSRISLRNNETLFLFIFAKNLVSAQPENEADEKTILREIYGDMGWETKAILSRMDEVENIYFDRISQIRMPQWTKGRVALIGDAAACASLLAGEGTGLAMTEAYILAGELHRADGDYKQAFRIYQTRLQSHLKEKQDAALKFAGFFAPKNWLSLIARDTMTNFASIPFLGQMILGSMFNDTFEFPNYEAIPHDRRTTS
ncbi:MAG: FAD-binding domain [Rhizobiaceae bacterium]